MTQMTCLHLNTYQKRSSQLNVCSRAQRDASKITMAFSEILVRKKMSFLWGK